jgi:hypothetical protein
MTEEQKRKLFIDLSGRLPYGVKIDTKRSGVIKLDHDNYSEGITIAGVLNTFPSSKPILRPLKDYQEVGWYDEDENEIHLSQYTDDGLFFHNISDSNDVPIEAVLDLREKLLEQHFDINGLIEEGLAINVNDLKENPYE